jgi:UDP-N-acetylmuramoylalanine--D-glutamate ligase
LYCLVVMNDSPKYLHIKWQGLKVAVLGYGVEGQSSVAYLLSKGAEVVVYDDKPVAAFDLPEYGDRVQWRLGDRAFADIDQCDWIIRSPGVPLTHAGLEDVNPNKMTSQVEIFLTQWRDQCVGVTGSKGKGTTVTLLAHLLQSVGHKVVVVGNIGRPVLDLLDEMDDQTIAVLELSSFQLQDIRVSPALAIMLMITPEHLNYHGDVLAYVEAKWQLLHWQGPQDQAIINIDYELSAGMAKQAPGRVWSISHHSSKGALIENNTVMVNIQQSEVLAVLDELPLRGRHNLENVAAAGLAGYYLGLSVSTMRQALFSYQPLPHHLTLVHKTADLEFYDDSFATTPEAAAAAITSFDQPLAVIVGGSDKGSDYWPLIETLTRYPHLKGVVAIGEVGPLIAQQLRNEGLTTPICEGLQCMSDMVAAASEQVQQGVVLLSPAAASFGLFKDYKDRGNQFTQAAKNNELHAE